MELQGNWVESYLERIGYSDSFELCYETLKTLTFSHLF